MAYIIAILTAGFSFLFNKAFIKKAGFLTIVFLSPVIEETSKSLAAFLFNADIFMTHFTFGAIEGFYDWYSGGRNKYFAAVLSVIVHSLLGFITVEMFMFTSNILFGVFVAVLAHIFWNGMVIYFSRKRSKTG